MSKGALPTRADTVAQVLDHVLAVAPERTAVSAPSGRLTYRELDSAADAAAALLADLGVRPGDRVAAALPNDLDIVVAFHGAMRLGAIWAGVNLALAPPEQEALLALSGAVLVLARPEATPPTPPGTRAVTLDAWRDGLRRFAGSPRPAPVDPHAPAALAFTSGTTGEPSGIVHSQHNLLLVAAAIATSRGYDEHLRKGDCLPLTILNMMVLTTLLAASAGGCTVLSDHRHARAVAGWIAEESLTVWNGVPALLHSMVHDEEIEAGQLATLAEVWVGGAGCPEELFGAFHGRFGAPVKATYGLTEAPTVVTIDPVDGEHVAGASGVALPHLAVSVLDDGGRPVPPGADGEITVGAVDEGPWKDAYTPMLGYWRDGGLHPVPAELLRTGDLGHVDADGRLVITDRKKLIIIRGSANISPAEVERVLNQAPGVATAVVVGVPDDRLGQRVAAVVEPTHPGATTEEALREHCLARLARYKVPDRVVFADRLARNAMGKVQRGGLAELFTHESRA